MVDIFLRKRFVLYPFTENSPKFNHRKESGLERSCVFIPIPHAGMSRIDMAWGGLFISVMGVWRCLRDDKLNYCPALFICNGLNTVSGVLTVKCDHEKRFI